MTARETTITSRSTAPDDNSQKSGGAFNALRKYRDFRLLWLSTLFVGTAQFMQQVAMGWIALELTDSPLFVGVVAFSAGTLLHPGRGSRRKLHRPVRPAPDLSHRPGHLRVDGPDPRDRCA